MHFDCWVQVGWACFAKHNPALAEKGKVEDVVGLEVLTEGHEKGNQYYGQVEPHMR